MNWRPSAGPDTLVLRAKLLQRARRFFADRNVLEVQTPVLVSSACPDPNIPGIAAQPWQGDTMFLHTSPEHAMKRLLCAGSGDIYQIGPVFRDGEAGRNHNPEFTMIEWYRIGYDQQQMAAETVELIKMLLASANDIASNIKVVRISYRDAFVQYVGVDPFTADLPELMAVCDHLNLLPATGLSDDRDACLDLLLGAVVGPAFPHDQVHVLYDYPASQAALARIRPGQPAVAERFEVFYGGMELGNGFRELGDATEQRQRFAAERKRYAATGRTTPPIDERLLAALAHGLPDCSGVAVGFDRLMMLATGQSSISQVLSFSFDRA